MTMLDMKLFLSVNRVNYIMYVYPFTLSIWSYSYKTLLIVSKSVYKLIKQFFTQDMIPT